VARAIGVAVADLKSLERPAPAIVRIVQVPDLRTVVAEEDVLVGDLARELQFRPESELPLEDFQSARTQLDQAPTREDEARLVCTIARGWGAAPSAAALRQPPNRPRHAWSQRRIAGRPPIRPQRVQTRPRLAVTPRSSANCSTTAASTFNSIVATTCPTSSSFAPNAASAEKIAAQRFASAEDRQRFVAMAREVIA
jgi:hypothetical protein